jgi:hypothetical protein
MIILICIKDYLYYIENYSSYHEGPLLENNNPFIKSFNYMLYLTNKKEYLFDTCLDINNIYLDIKDKDYSIGFNDLNKYIDDYGNLLPQNYSIY